MWYVAYNILLVLALPVVVLMLLAKRRCRRGLGERLGFLSGSRAGESRSGDGALWVHAVSLGEVVAVAPLVRQLYRLYPGRRITVSTVTETGREAVERLLAGVAIHCYAPLDFPWTVSRVVRRLNPSAFLFVETELWPNLLRTLARRRVPAVLVNGRLSSRSFGRYALVKPFMRSVLADVSMCLMQSERDVERLVTLGAEPQRVVRTGNIKFDQPLPVEGNGLPAVSRRAIGLGEGEEVLVAGSTHAGEEETLISCYAQLRREFPTLVLLLAPRHIERVSQLEATIRAAGFPALRRSLVAQGDDVAADTGQARVLILDTRGELASVYRHAVLSFVGGTLVPVGGHNLLEPAAWGKPVLFGPYTDHCAETARLLVQAGGGVAVRDGEDLRDAIGAYLRDRAALQRAGALARRMVEENQGATERALAHITKVLDGLGGKTDK